MPPGAQTNPRSWGPFAAEAGTYALNEPNGSHSIDAADRRESGGDGAGVFTTYHTGWRYRAGVMQQRNQNGPLANPVRLIRVE
jgi:hypothetical protein